MKLTKREFVKAGVALSVVPGVLLVNQERARFDVVVYNEWFPEARELARMPGVTALPIQGDAGKLWYGPLRARIDAGARRIAGLTTHTDLLILETLARESGLKVRQRNSQTRLVSWVMS